MRTRRLTIPTGQFENDLLTVNCFLLSLSENVDVNACSYIFAPSYTSGKAPGGMVQSHVVK